MKKKVGIIRCIFQIIVMLLTILAFSGCGTKQFEDPLTPQEREWLKAHDGNIVMALETSYAPFAFVDENGNGRGLATEHIKLIEKKLNFRIQKIHFNSLNEILSSAQKKEIDIVNAVTETQDRSSYLLFTKPFINIPNVIIVRKDRKDSLTIDKMQNMKISLVKNYAITEHLKKNYNELNVVLMPDDLSALMSVSFNQADATIIDLATASYFIEQKGITNLRIAGEAGYNIKLAIASRNDWPILNRIMEKGLFSITDKEKKSIKDKWISFGQTRLSESKGFWIIIVSVFLVFLLVVLGIMVWNRLLTRQVEQSTIQLKKELAVRNQSEKELKELKLKLSNALDMAHLGHWEYDVVNDLFIFNDHFYRIFGTTAEQVGGYSMSSAEYAFRFVHPDDMHMVEEETRKAIETDSPNFNRQLEHRILYADGQVGYISVRFFIDKDSQGRTVWVYGVNQDITERKQAEEALRLSEERFRSIFESTTDFIFLKDHNMRYIMVNPAMIQLFGRPVEDLIGRDDRELFGAEAAEHIEEIDTRVLAGETVEEEDKKPVNDKQLIFHVKKTPVWGADGSVAALCGIARDITDHKQIEEKLHQAQKMRAIGTLAGGIAHEFNNMLGIIMGNTELAIDDLPDSHPVKRYLEETMTASLRARDVVRKLLSVARKSMTTKKTIQINNVVQETLSLLRRTIPTTIDIRSNLFCTTEKILADPTEISQLVMNLCINSAHSMSGEPGILEVRLEAITLDERSAARYEHSQPGDYARLTVIDTGAGIPPDIMDRIFDPYFTTKSVDEGLGLGLAIVHGIVKSHDGMINIESETGKGTTVEVMIPLVDSQPESTEKETGMLPVGSERILLIDDEASLVEMVKQMITRFGYEVVAKTDSMDALMLFSSDPFRFDLVITDMAMPGMDGDRLAREILRIRPDTPIIMCTGHSDHMDEEKARVLGIKAFIMKPITKTDISKTIRNVLDKIT